jgi:hypothetical protein
MAGFEFENKEQVIGVLAPELSTPEAIQGLPDAQALYQQRIQEHDQAREEVKRCEAVCDANREALRFLRDRQEALFSERKAFEATSCAEVYALRDVCDIEGVGCLLRKKNDAIEFIDFAYSNLLQLKAPLNDIDLLDSLVKQAIAEHAELSQAAALSRMRTIATLGPLLETEGEVGIIGKGTEQLRSAAQAALKRVETAKQAARDARTAFDSAEAVRISTGLVTSKNVNQAIPQY